MSRVWALLTVICIPVGLLLVAAGSLGVLFGIVLVSLPLGMVLSGRARQRRKTGLWREGALRAIIVADPHDGDEVYALRASDLPRVKTSHGSSAPLARPEDVVVPRLPVFAEDLGAAAEVKRGTRQQSAPLSDPEAKLEIEDLATRDVER